MEREPGTFLPWAPPFGQNILALLGPSSLHFKVASSCPWNVNLSNWTQRFGVEGTQVKTGHEGKSELSWSYLIIGIWSQGREDPLEKEMETHSSILGWRIPWTEEPGGLQSTGSERVGQGLATKQQKQ